MKQGMIFVFLLMLGALAACSGIPSAEVSPTPGPSADIVSTPTPEPTPTPNLYMYEGAVEDFLLPFEDYSWEREYGVEYVMLHFTSAVRDHPEDPYNLDTIRGIFEEAKVSIHYIVDRDGAVYCYMPETRAAWHAGKGTYADDEKYTNKMNYYAIGIELVAIGSKDDMAQYMSSAEYDALNPDLIGFTDVQYTALRTLVGDICNRHHVPMDEMHVIGHQDYSEGKADPGELFDWARLFS